MSWDQQRGGKLIEELNQAVRRLLVSPLADDQRLLVDTMAARLATLGEMLEVSPTPAREPSPGNRILIAEDNPFTQTLMTRLLERHGFQAQVVDNGVLLLDRLAELDWQGVDLVLMDLKMPEMDGWTAARTIREVEKDKELPRLPIIAVTALSGEEEEQQALAAGMDAFHSKPVKAQILFAEIARLVSHAAPAAVPAASPAPTAEAPPFDLDAVMRSLEGDWDLYQEIVHLFLGDIPTLINTIRTGISEGDAHRVYESAHSLKGASGAFGKTRVYENALELEMLGRQGKLERAPDCLLRLTRELDILEGALRASLRREDT